MSKLNVTNFNNRAGSPFKRNDGKEDVVQEVVLQKTAQDIQKERKNELLQKAHKKAVEYQSNKPSSGVFTEVVTHGAFTSKKEKEKSPKLESVPSKTNGGSNSKSLLGFPSSANDLALDAKTDLESDPNISKEVKEKVIEKLFALVSMVQHTYESKVRIMTEFDKFKDIHLKNELRREKEHSEQLYKLNMNFQNEVIQSIQQLKILDIGNWHHNLLLMAATKLWCWCLFIVSTSVRAVPECRYVGDKQTHVVCSSTEAYMLTRGLVSDNKTTTGVILKDCKITDIEYESFENMPALEFIDLSRNNITSLKLGVLDGIRTVINLNLSYNSLTEFPLGVFDQMPNLAVLDLNGNKFHNFQLGVFDPLIKMKFLKLSNNLLIGKDMNPYLFDESWQIDYLDLSRNDMANSPEILLHSFLSLETLVLDKCFLSEVPSFAVKSNLKTLKQLFLSRNHISKIENSTTFVNLDSLESLDLSDNGIEIISEDVFKPLKKIKAIVLRGNRLTALPSTLFKNLGSLINIDLSRNMIATVSVSTFIGTSLKNLNLANNRFTYLIDNFCLELKNSGAKLSKFYFNQNPWQCSCLRDVLDEVKRMDIKYNSVSYDGTHPVCVTTREMRCKRHDEFNSIYTNMYDDLILNASYR